MNASILETNSVHKSYFQGQTEISVLKGIDLQVSPGETIAIIGQSGSGKSTLLSILAGLDRPSSGSITLASANINQMSEKELTSFRGKQLGIIFQQFHLINSLTASENVSLPLEIASIPNAQEKALKALDLVGLSHRAHHLPHQLSGGECQRVAIARAFVIEPKLLLADEPSGNLDQETGQMVMNLLFDAVKKRNMTMILVTHDDDLANRCQRKLLLKNGTLIPVGV